MFLSLSFIAFIALLFCFLGIVSFAIFPHPFTLFLLKFAPVLRYNLSHPPLFSSLFLPLFIFHHSPYHGSHHFQPCYLFIFPLPNPHQLSVCLSGSVHSFPPLLIVSFLSLSILSILCSLCFHNSFLFLLSTLSSNFSILSFLLCLCLFLFFS